MTDFRGGLGDHTLAAVCGAIAAPTPVPGGGSAAAMAGAISGALLEMAALISQRKADDEKAKRLADIAGQAARTRTRMLELADLDARAYDQVIAARRLPRSTESEVNTRNRAIEQAAVMAARVPRDTAGLGMELVATADQLAVDGSKAVFSDIAVGRDLARVAVAGGRANVEANLADMNPADRKKFECWLAEQFREEHTGEGQYD